jgi:ABC-2 type transport system permease protein
VNATFLRLELLRLFRNKRVLVFSLVVPVALYLGISSGAKDSDRLGGFTVATYIMVSMAGYSAQIALLAGGARIAFERQVGWNRQVRIAGMPGGTYVRTKVALSYASAVPGLVAVLIAGAVTNADLHGVRWVTAPLALLLALAPIAALGVLVGYLVKPDSVQQIMGLGSAAMGFLGGQFIPAAQFSSGMLDVVKLFPPYWSTEVGRHVVAGVSLPVEGYIVLVTWTVALSALAARAYARDSSK